MFCLADSMICYIFALDFKGKSCFVHKILKRIYGSCY